MNPYAGQVTAEEQEEKFRKAVEARGIRLEDLTPEQRRALFASYSDMLDQADQRTARGQQWLKGKHVGPEDHEIYVAPNWGEVLAGAVSTGLGSYQRAKARRGQRKAREAAAQLLSGTRTPADEEERRTGWLNFFGRGF